MSTSLKPTSKVQAAGAAGALTIVLVWIVGLFGVEVPAEVASSFTVLVATGAAYAKREPKADSATDLAATRAQLASLPPLQLDAQEIFEAVRLRLLEERQEPKPDAESGDA